MVDRILRSKDFKEQAKFIKSITENLSKSTQKEILDSLGAADPEFAEKILEESIHEQLKNFRAALRQGDALQGDASMATTRLDARSALDTKNMESLFKTLSPEKRRACVMRHCPLLFTLLSKSIISDNLCKEEKAINNRVTKFEQAKSINSMETAVSSGSGLPALFKALQKRGSSSRDPGVNVALDVRVKALETEIDRLNDEAASIQKTLDHKLDQAANLCEVVAGMQAAESECTSSALEYGLLLRLSGLSKTTHEISTQKGYACSRSMANNIVKELCKTYLETVRAELKESSANPENILLVILDNYNVLRWLKRISVTDSFTHNLATLSILTRTLRRQTRPDDAADNPANVPIGADTNSALEDLCESLGSAWTLREEHQQLSDGSYMTQSLFLFTPYPSVLGKSSSESDIRDMIIGDLLEGLCKMAEHEVIVIVDPEIILLFGKRTIIEPEKLKNLILGPPVFHIRSHCINNIANDPFFLQLLFLPYMIECMGLQVAKKTKTSNDIKAKMKKDIAAKLTVLVASAQGAPGADAKGGARASGDEAKAEGDAKPDAKADAKEAGREGDAMADAKEAEREGDANAAGNEAKESGGAAKAQTKTRAQTSKKSAGRGRGRGDKQTMASSQGPAGGGAGDLPAAAAAAVQTVEGLMSLSSPPPATTKGVHTESSTKNDLLGACKMKEDNDDGGDVADFGEDEDELEYLLAHDERELDDEDNRVNYNKHITMLDDHGLQLLMTQLRQYELLGCRGGDLSHDQMKGTKLNFARQFFLVQQLYCAYEMSTAEIRNIVGDSPSWAARCFLDLLEKGVKGICMDPFREIVLHGRGQMFMERVPQFINLMGFYKRDKVVRALFYLFGNFNRYRTVRPDLMSGYLVECCKFNDHFIELYNSLTQGALPTTCTLTERDIHEASCKVVIKHNLVKEIRSHEKLLKQKLSNSERAGEVREAELKCATKSAKADQKDYIKPWLLKYLTRLQATEVPGWRLLCPENTAEPKDDCGLFSDVLEKGRLRVVGEVKTKFQDYVAAVQAKAARQQTFRDLAGRGEHLKLFLKNPFGEGNTTKFTKPWLMAALNAKNLRGISNLKVDALIDLVVVHYRTKDAFKQFVVDNDLTAEKCKNLTRNHQFVTRENRDSDDEEEGAEGEGEGEG